jgi:hypothetical protein
MEQPTGIEELEERVALVDAAVRPIAQRPVDITDPDWETKMRQRPAPLDQAGVRAEATATDATAARLPLSWPASWASRSQRSPRP